jgi:hypothetical protein
MSFRLSAATFVIAAVFLGCGKKEPPDAAKHTERERDSTIGASQLPGATGVRGALRVSDSAGARRAREDTVN